MKSRLVEAAVAILNNNRYLTEAVRSEAEQAAKDKFYVGLADIRDGHQSVTGDEEDGPNIAPFHPNKSHLGKKHIVSSMGGSGIDHVMKTPEGRYAQVYGLHPDVIEDVPKLEKHVKVKNPHLSPRDRAHVVKAIVTAHKHNYFDEYGGY